jgi:hypothetical protein
MRTSRLGGFLLAVGAAVGVVAFVGLATGFEPSRLPPALLDIAAYKLTIAAAAGLLVVGAMIRRRGLREEARSDGARARDTAHAAPAREALPPMPLDDIPVPDAKEASKVDAP